MAASAQLLLDALSSAPEYPAARSESCGPEKNEPEKPTEPDLFDGVSDPDSGLDGSGSLCFCEPPLTSEPPLADAAPLTSESPIAAELPLTSEPTAAGLGTESMEV
ncbi:MULTISPECIES: hypothetical protein [Streptomyces]|uniref:Uncharacterized protein n=2 Tax=Streptomyces rimosus subsp. rimosus TaxID=132474 RepID=L8EQI3_STRR1|nr:MULTISPECIES: hypothetical protein [Streptomyces]KOG71901.1 hypothetical protein ADK78_22585 [Kitasatospora aureofaciens]KWT59316.1 hypothetical protein ADL21_24465 [Streptomyces albus subsp. albus]MYT48641.1 hypothetical protein [Streptomyces sp. SID5471]KEF06085.1 hypothetical protein DF17_16230 [Streptomyces rimosus]KEF19079.1 hypothetical protein DF18_19675 [Streptomyces rimosus]